MCIMSHAVFHDDVPARLTYVGSVNKHELVKTHLCALGGTNFTTDDGE